MPGSHSFLLSFRVTFKSDELETARVRDDRGARFGRGAFGSNGRGRSKPPVAPVVRYLDHLLNAAVSRLRFGEGERNLAAGPALGRGQARDGVFFVHGGQSKAVGNQVDDTVFVRMVARAALVQGPPGGSKNAYRRDDRESKAVAAET